MVARYTFIGEKMILTDPDQLRRDSEISKWFAKMKFKYFKEFDKDEHVTNAIDDFLEYLMYFDSQGNAIK